MKIDFKKLNPVTNVKTRIGLIILCALAVSAIVIIVLANKSDNEEVVYRETQVLKGNLTVGVEIDGTIEVGTTTQELEIDLSEYTGSSSFSFSNMNNISAGGAMPGGGGMSGGSGMPGATGGTSGGSGGITFGGESSNTASGNRTLKVEAVYVSPGQQIKVGDSILKLSEESVNEIRSDLEQDVASAEITYKQQITEAQLANLSAEQEHESNLNEGGYAAIELEQSLETYQEAVDAAQEELDDANETLTELNEDLIEYQSKVTEYKKLLDNANYTAENIEVVGEVYGWTTAENAREEAQALYDELLDNIESTTENIETQKSKVAECESRLASALNNQTQGMIEAQATYDKNMLNYDNAEEIYTVSMGKTELSNDIASDDYEEALSKLEEFNQCIDGQTVKAAYDGVVTDVPISVGDYIGTGSQLLTLNDYDEVTVTVSVPESDIEYAQEGAVVNVFVPAMPDEEFTAQVTEVGDANYNSSDAKTYYEVTVTLSGKTELLYEGMNVELTFITKETKEVTYVSNRAIIREDGLSMVKMKDEKGNVVTKEVVTGFSDGNNVEIKSGLSEGETVLIESKVKE